MPLGTGRGRAVALGAALGGLAFALSAGAGCGDRFLYPWGPTMDGGMGGAGGAGGADGGAGGGPPPDAGSDGPPIACSNPDEPEGFASLGDSTTGGSGAMTVTPTTQEELQMYADMDVRLVIQIESVITVSGQVDFNKPNKTVEGIGANAGITGGGVRVKNTGNIIFRNLNISKAVGTDCITIETANHVWVDHCDLSGDRTSPVDTYDDLIDVTHGSDLITVSWTRFHDHNREASFVGNSDNTAAEDMGHLNVTFHHNIFTRTRAQNPSLRFGVVHAYNNYLKDIDTIGMSARLGGKLFAERNYFDGVPTSMTTRPDLAVAEGFLQDVSNVYVNSALPVNPQLTTVLPPYVATFDSVSEVPVKVLSCAGTGKIGL